MKKVGILGGGQLALMMLPAIKELGYQSVVLDLPGASCEGLAHEFIPGDFKNPSEVQKLDHCDFVTYEIESISIEGFKELAEKTCVAPIPSALETIQDKGVQKNFLKDLQVPSSNFEVKTLHGSEEFENKVVKLCRDGYDGRGVWIPKPGSEAPKSFIGKNCLIEDKVEIERELSQVCSRSHNGKTEFYELVEMVMDPELNLLDYQINPSSIDDKISGQAKEYAQKILDGLEYVGTLAVELFLTKNGELLVNEIAPRVHNSGHNTIESAPTSQFENHVRAITKNELGPALPARPSLTMNLLGEGDSGPTHVENQISDDKTFVHLYNKRESRPGRKMGHITMLGDSKNLIANKDKIKKQITITGRSS